MKFDLSKKAQFRLLKLAEHMRSLPPKAARHFDMENWMRHLSEDGHKHVATDEDVKLDDLLECGTTACALGWATTSPYFRRIGLKLVAGDGPFAKVRLGRTSRAAYDVFELAMKVFDLNLPEAHYFFRDINARTPKQWARQVEKRIA
jgi:hypothetical protein